MKTHYLKKFKEKLTHKQDIILDFVGDSVTWGLNHCDAENTYVAWFARFVAQMFNDYKVVRFDGEVKAESLPIERFDGPFIVGGENNTPTLTVIRNGVGGNTVRRAILRSQDFIGELAVGKRADVTFFMFGINDALSSDPLKYVTKEKFASDYDELLTLSEKGNESLNIVITPSYNGDFPINEYAEKAKAVAEKHGVPVIDLNALWQEHFDPSANNYGQGEWLSGKVGDSCHLSVKGAEDTAKFIFDEFLKLVDIKWWK